MPAIIKSVSSPRDMAMCLEHVARVHGSSLATEVGSWYKDLPGFSPDRVFFIEADGVAISHACVIDRPILIGGTPITAGEIALVGTVQERRERGFARVMLEHLLGYMRRQRYPMAFLFGIPEFYERFGFRYGLRTFISRRDTTIRVRDLLALRLPPGYSVRAIEQSDIPALSLLYQRDTEEATGAAARDAPYWRWLFSHTVEAGLMPAGNRLVVERNGRLVGYALIADRPLNSMIGQCAPWYSIAEGVASNRESSDALLRAGAEKAGSANASEMSVYLRPDSLLGKRVAELGATVHRPTKCDYVKVIDLESLLRQLKGVLETRLKRSRFSGEKVSLRIETEEQHSTVTVGRGRPRILHVTIPQADLGPLVTGFKPVPEQGSLLCSVESLPVLEALFPPQEPLFSMLDLL